MGDGGLGIGDWAQSPIPNPQSPIPNPQSPLLKVINIENKFYIDIKIKHNYLHLLLYDEIKKIM